ncbi:hypothetical protein GYMLUDRAFT_648668 [Collybiopsis luxurians FD-317 M1]|nr:hypothetical protein GYMLUDRAFT_648668 [Collybiopsis luxurians FD-317 M1]
MSHSRSQNLLPQHAQQFAGAHDFSINGGQFNAIQGDQYHIINNFQQNPNNFYTRSEVHNASYKSEHHSYCLEGTRVEILQSLIEWVTNIESPHIYWLYGIAGTGKSTITQSFCKELEEIGFIVGSFFCSRNATERSDVLRIFPTIAETFARADTFYGDAITKVLEKDPYVASYSVSEQIKHLFIKHGMNFHSQWAIVIDGLDECSDAALVMHAIEVLIDNAHVLPAYVFIASREVKEVSYKFHASKYLAKVALHEVERFIVETDIQHYVEYELSRIPSLTPPIDSHVKYLVEQSAGLFIYASTAIKYIAEGYNSDQRIQVLMAQKKLQGINQLYANILNDIDGRVEDADIYMLQTLINLQEPLSIPALEALLNVKLFHSLSAFKSVLQLPSLIKSNIKVQSFHASFPEFLENAEDCPQRYYISFDKKHECHAYLALCCLEYLNKNLQRNPLGLELYSEVSRLDGEQISVYMNEYPCLEYACKFWTTHWVLGAKDTSFHEAMHSSLLEFLHKHVLKWIEHLILLRWFEFIRDINNILPYIKDDLYDYLSELCTFLAQSADVLSKWPLDIYSSAVIWIPKDSLLKDLHCFQERDMIAPAIITKTERWSRYEHVIELGSLAHGIAVFHDEARVVTALHSGTLQVWNSLSCRLELMLDGHTDSVQSVAVFPDNSQIVSGSDDCTVRVWSSTTGKTDYVLEGHSLGVAAVAIFADGSRIVSGSDDKTLRIWNTSTRSTDHVLNGHADSVTAVAVLSDCSKLVSGSKDRTVRIWNASSGATEHVLKGHSEGVIAIAVLPHSARVVSGASDSKICIWNTITGQLEDTFKGNPLAIAVSLDASKIVIGSNDHTIKIWNIADRKPEKVLKFSSSITTIAVFQNTSKVVSCFNDWTLRIWNSSVHQGGTVPKKRPSGIEALAIIPGHFKIVSVSNDMKARVWDSLTGKMGLVLNKQSIAGTAIAVFADGFRVVLCSYNSTLIIWNPSTGNIQSVLKGHTSLVTAIAVFPDDFRLASGSYDGTVRIWNSKNGKAEHILEGHSDWVSAVAVFPDQTRIASGCHDGTVRIWNTFSGKLEHMIEGPFPWLTAVAVSPDATQLFSFSNDNILCTWDASTGAKVGHIFLPTNVSSKWFPLHRVIAGYHPVYVLSNFLDEILLLHHTPNNNQNYKVQHIIWIPPHLRKISHFVSYESLICLGYKNGEVVIIDMASPQSPSFQTSSDPKKRRAWAHVKRWFKKWE